MDSFELRPADILVKLNYGKDLVSRIKRWAVGPADHVFLYMGKVGIIVSRKQPRVLRVPMLFESNGGGVVFDNLSTRYDEDVVVMRLKSGHDRRQIPWVLEEAVRLAGDPRAVYDYKCILRFIIPRLILKKLDGLLPGDWVLPQPLRWARDPLQVCSEAVFEVFCRAGLVDILPTWRVPLPGDFGTDSPLLAEVWRGTLSEELVSGG